MSSEASVKGLVLAGGKGTRLRPLTYSMAKQLVPVANKPILHFAMDSMHAGGIREFGIIISPETGEAIKESLAQWQAGLNSPDEVQLTYIPQDAPSGLAHAVKISRPYLGDSPFMMYLGDNLINADLKALIQRFLEARCDASIMLKSVPNPSSFGVAEVDANRNVVRLVEKPKEPKSDLALVGVYLFSAKIFDAIERIKPSWRNELEITDAIQRLIDDKGSVHSSVHEGWWLDTGKKDDLLEANKIVLQDCLKAEILGVVDAESELSGIVRVGKKAKLTRCKVTGPAVIGDGCVLEDAIIGPNTSLGHQSVVKGANIESSVLLESCQVLNYPGRIENSLIGKECKISGPRPNSQSHQFLLADNSEIC